MSILHTYIKDTTTNVCSCVFVVGFAWLPAPFNVNFFDTANNLILDFVGPFGKCDPFVLSDDHFLIYLIKVATNGKLFLFHLSFF